MSLPYMRRRRQAHHVLDFPATIGASSQPAPASPDLWVWFSLRQSWVDKEQEQSWRAPIFWPAEMMKWCSESRGYFHIEPLKTAAYTLIPTHDSIQTGHHTCARTKLYPVSEISRPASFSKPSLPRMLYLYNDGYAIMQQLHFKSNHNTMHVYKCDINS
jgi:hypothetical protein